MAQRTNVYCIRCGYNLRGLAGNPRTCPECGYPNWSSDLDVPEELVVRELKRLETIPTLSVIGFIGTVIGLLVGYLGYTATAFVVVVPSALLWITLTLWFAHKCARRSGWIVVLAWFHATGVSGLTLLGGISTLGYSCHELLPDRAWFVLYSALVLLGIAGIGKKRLRRLYPYTPLYHARKRLAALCREIAIARAKDAAKRGVSVVSE